MSTTSPLFNSPDADVVLRSSDGVDFHVDLTMLTMASPVFRDMATLPTPPSQGNTGGRPIIPLQTTSTTLELLLQLVHPSMHPNFEQVTDLSVYGELLRAADMYHMPKVAPAIGHALVDPRLLATEEGALYMFAMASRYGLDARARAAAKALLLYPPPHERDVEPAGFRDLPAMAYHRLLNYRRRCVGVLFSETDAPYERQWVDGWWRSNVAVRLLTGGTFGRIVKATTSRATAWLTPDLRRSGSATSKSASREHTPGRSPSNMSHPQNS